LCGGEWDIGDIVLGPKERIQGHEYVEKEKELQEKQSKLIIERVALE
jgi:hypothetical protein